MKISDGRKIAGDALRREADIAQAVHERGDVLVADVVQRVNAPRFEERKISGEVTLVGVDGICCEAFL